jgi:GTP-binding nuclear protein Ran
LSTSKANETPQFKLILVGDGGVGKEALVARQPMATHLESQHVAPLGVTIKKLVFHTSRGLIQFNIWDTAGQEKFGGIRDGFLIQAECAILMYDTTSSSTFTNVHNWRRDLTRVTQNIPILVVGNTPAGGRGRIRQFTVPHIEISAEQGINMEAPFLYLARVLSGDNHLTFVAPPALPPTLDEASQALYEAIMAENDDNQAYEDAKIAWVAAYEAENGL